MKKRIITISVLLLVIVSLVIAAQTSQSVKQFLFGREEAVVGEAGLEPPGNLRDLMNLPGPQSYELYQVGNSFYILDTETNVVYYLETGGVLVQSELGPSAFSTSSFKIATYQDRDNKWKGTRFVTEEVERNLNERDLAEIEPPFSLQPAQEIRITDLLGYNNYLTFANVDELNSRGVLINKGVKYEFDSQGNLLITQGASTTRINPEGEILSVAPVEVETTRQRSLSEPDQSRAAQLGYDPIGDLFYYVDEFGQVYSRDGTKITDQNQLNLIKSDVDYESSVNAAKNKANIEVVTIKDKLTCLDDPDCKKEKITYSEAYERISSLAAQAELAAAQGQKVIDAAKKADALGEQWKKAKPGSPEEARLEEEYQQALEEQNRLEQETDLTIEEAQARKKKADDLQRQADSLQWKGSWYDHLKKDNNYQSLKDALSNVGAYANFVSRLGSYQALSNLLLPDLTQDFIDVANSEFFNKFVVIGESVPAAICKIDNDRSSSQPGQNAAFVQTAGNTYQFVGAIHAEKSKTKSPILCQQNASDDFFCKGNLVCKDDAFCYTDEDAIQPVEGFFYKITWGVSAPADEKFTPNIDENGKAVKFNIQLRGSDGRRYLYHKGPLQNDAVIQLNNGARDGATLIQFSERPYTQVCIVFSSTALVEDYFGDEVKEICADFIETKRGELEYESSERSPSVPSTSQDVSYDTDW